MSPGVTIHRLTDTALKATGVHLVQQVVERAYSSIVITTATRATCKPGSAILLLISPGEYQSRLSPSFDSTVDAKSEVLAIEVDLVQQFPLRG